MVTSDLPRSVAAVSQCHVPPSQFVHHPKRIQATVNSVTTLYADQRRDLSIFVRVFYSLGCSDESKIIRVLLDHSQDDIYLLKEQADRVLVLVAAGYVC